MRRACCSRPTTSGSGGNWRRPARAAFAIPPTGPNQVWQLDFSEFETAHGGTWRVAAVIDYWSKYEFAWHWSPTANQYDTIAAV
jgi:transposase InsO family protein